MPSAPATPNNVWRLGFLVFFAVLLLSIPQAALLPLLDRDEPRFAEASREMLESSNIIVPTFNNAPRYAKPPLIYWCQALSFSIFGENAFAARLPTLLATAGTALLLFWWGAQFGYKSIGLIAAFSYAFCLQTVQQGRVATADGLLIFFMTLTGLAGWNLLSLGKPSANLKDFRFWKWRLILGLAGGFLAKGPEAWLPLLPLIFMAPAVWRFWLQFFVLSLVFVAAWAIPAYLMTHGDYWRVGLSEGIGQRMVTGLQGHGASSLGGYLLGVLFYYPLWFLFGALPWWPLMVLRAKKLFVPWKMNLIDSYLLLNIGIIFLVFSLMATKLPHYTLPAFPFIALFFARRWVSLGLNPGLPIKLTLNFGIGFALFAGVFIPFAMANHGTPSPAGALMRAAQSDGALPSGTEFAMVDFQEPNVVWEMRRVVKGYGQAIPESDVVVFLNQKGPRAVVLSTALWRKIAATPGMEGGWKTYEAQGFNAAKGRFIDLTLVVKS